MAEVTLTSVWLQTASDLSDSMTLKVRDWDEETSTYAQRRGYAGGVTRTVTRPGVLQDLHLFAPMVSRDDWTALQSRGGALQLMRDTRGRRWWGTVGALKADEFRTSDQLRSVSFTFSRITYTEVV